MRVPIEWLREFVDICENVNVVAERLTFAGLEVAGIINVAEAYSSFKVAKILSFKQHPKSDKLWIAEIALGENEKATVVAGIANYKVGDFVPFVPVGGKMPSGQEITGRSFDGIASNGMLCSMKELDLGPDASGIWTLNDVIKNPKTGEGLGKVLGLDEPVLEVELTPNRGDCLGIIGIAREVSAIFGLEMKLNEVKAEPLTISKNDMVSIEVLEPKACPLYSARVIRSVKVGPSPWWMSKRLILAGVRSINNIVDISNYILLERNHPLHTFDLRDISSAKIIVRYAKEGEKFVALDESEHILNSRDLVIADSERAVALAGVMGGLNSEVREDTTDVLLEAAYFEPMTIRRTASRHGIHSESSHRFERGVDYAGVLRASARAGTLICELSGGKAMGAAVGVDETVKFKKEPVPFNFEYAEKIIGAEVDKPKARKIFSSLGIEKVSEEPFIAMAGSVIAVLGDTKGGDLYRPPTWRHDISRPIDLVEEVGRMIGYDRIPETIPLPRYQQIYRKESVANAWQERRKNELRHLLSHAGLYETINLSFLSTKLLDRTHIQYNLSELVKIVNPLSEDYTYLRPSLLPCLLRSCEYNQRRQIKDVRLFELATIFHFDEKNKKTNEKLSVGAVLGGEMARTFITAERRNYDFYDLKGIVEQILLFCEIDQAEIQPCGATGIFHPHRSAKIVDKATGTTLGLMGELHPSVVKEFEMNMPYFAFELDGGVLLSVTHKKQGIAAPSDLPATSRDIAVVVDEKVNANELLAAIAYHLKEVEESLEELTLFDVYSGKGVDENKKSLAFRFTLRAKTRTFTDEEIEQLVTRIVKGLEKEFNAKLRQ